MGEFETVHGNKGKNPEEVNLGLRERNEEMSEKRSI